MSIGQGDDHAQMLAYVGECLTRGATDRRSPLHTPTISALGQDGRPRMRTVVLRGFDFATRTLRFHTDLRSEKVAELKQDHRIGFHAYDAGAKLQIRLDGVATIHATDALADEAWAAAQPMSRLTYSVSPGPGSVIATGADYAVSTDRDATTLGRDVFAVVVVQFDQLEWLWLAATGHRRALVSWDGAGAATHKWLVP